MERIKKLASYTRGSRVVCDIGCDHAYALIYAIQEYGVVSGIAADIALGPLKNALQSIQQAGLEDCIKTIQSDGFHALDKNSFDTAIIAGMGGILMCSILEQGLEKIRDKTLILEANQDTYRVRDFLFTHDFQIVEEEALFEDGKYYEIIVAKDGRMDYDGLDIFYGPILRRKKSQAFLKKYEEKLQQLTAILKQIKDPLKKKEKLKEAYEIYFLLKGIQMERKFILNTKNYYRTYFIDELKRPTILITPGGAYQYTSPRESEPVAEAFLKKGYHVVIVNYRETLEDGYPLLGQYVAEVIQILRLDSRVGKIIGLGFSAGGHCILEVCLHHKDYQIDPLDYLMLAYPVVSSDLEIAHKESFHSLLKEKENDASLRNYLSLEKEVTKENAVDLFLWGTITDSSVSVLNSLRLIEAYYAVGGNVEYHLFPFGGHGLSVANPMSSEGDSSKESPYIARWVDLASSWIEEKLKQA